MTTAIALNDVFVPAVKEDFDFDAAIKGKDYLGYLVVAQANSKYTDEGIEAGHLVHVKDKDFTDLGPSIDAKFCNRRMKAMAFGQTVICNYDPESAQYKEFESKAPKTRQVADEKGLKYMYGPEYLLWIPELDDFTTFFCSNPTAHKLAKKIINPLYKQGIRDLTMARDRKANAAQQKWWGLKITESVTPIEDPDIEDAHKANSLFLNPNPSAEMVEGEAVDR